MTTVDFLCSLVCLFRFILVLFNINFHSLASCALLSQPADHGAGQEPCHDAGNDAEPGPCSEQLGEHPRRLQCLAEDVHRHPGTHVQRCQGTGIWQGCLLIKSLFVYTVIILTRTCFYTFSNSPHGFICICVAWLTVSDCLVYFPVVR